MLTCSSGPISQPVNIDALGPLIQLHFSHVQKVPSAYQPQNICSEVFSEQSRCPWDSGLRPTFCTQTSSKCRGNLLTGHEA